VVHFLEPTLADRPFEARVARLVFTGSHMIVSYLSVVVFLIRNLLFFLPGVAVFPTISLKKETRTIAFCWQIIAAAVARASFRKIAFLYFSRLLVFARLL
jgi:hypothetical protein